MHFMIKLYQIGTTAIKFIAMRNNARDDNTGKTKPKSKRDAA